MYKLDSAWILDLKKQTKRKFVFHKHKCKVNMTIENNDFIINGFKVYYQDYICLCGFNINLNELKEKCKLPPIIELQILNKNQNDIWFDVTSYFKTVLPNYFN